MRKICGFVLLAFGVIVMLSIAILWLQGGNVVHEMTYQQFVDGHSNLDNGSYVKITGGRVDAVSLKSYYLFILMNVDMSKDMEPNAFLSMTGGDNAILFAPYYGSGSPPSENGIYVRFNPSDTVNLPHSLTGSSIKDQYMPLVVMGKIANGFYTMDDDGVRADHDGFVIDYDSPQEPVFYSIVTSIIIILIGIRLVNKKKERERLIDDPSEDEVPT